MRTTHWLMTLAVLLGMFSLAPKASAHLNPTLGRFMQQDPLGYVDGMSRYQYLGSSPFTHIDYAGLLTAAPLAPSVTPISAADTAATGITEGVGGELMAGGGAAATIETGTVAGAPPSGAAVLAPAAVIGGSIYYSGAGQYLGTDAAGNLITDSYAGGDEAELAAMRVAINNAYNKSQAEHAKTKGKGDGGKCPPPPPDDPCPPIIAELNRLGANLEKLDIVIRHGIKRGKDMSPQIANRKGVQDAYDKQWMKAMDHGCFPPDDGGEPIPFPFPKPDPLPLRRAA